MNSPSRGVSSPPEASGGRILRPSERFANTGAFGDNGIFGQGASLAPSKTTYSPLSPITTPSSASSASLATPSSTAPSSRYGSPTATKNGLPLADHSRLEFLDFDPTAANAYPLPPGAASGRNDTEAPFGLSSSLTFRVASIPPRSSDFMASNEAKLSPSAPQTPSKKKFFSFGRNSSKKDYSSSALSDDEGPPLSETPNKRFSRFSRSFSSGTPSSSAGKRSKSVGPGPRPSITSFESNESSIRQIVPSSSSSTLNDEWILLQKRDPSPPKHRDHPLPSADGSDAQERLMASPPPDKADTRNQAVVKTPPPLSTRTALPAVPVQMSPVQSSKPGLPALPTSPPFYPTSVPRNQPRTSTGHPGGSPAFLKAATARMPESRGSTNTSDPFGPPLVASKPAIRQPDSTEQERKEVQANLVAHVSPPSVPVPKAALQPAMTSAQAKRKSHSPVPASNGKSASSRNATSRRQSSVPPKPVPHAQLRQSELQSGERVLPARPNVALTAQNLSAGTQPASSTSLEACTEPEITCSGKPRFEESLVEHQQILINILDYLDFPTLRTICRLSRALRFALSRPSSVELACERFIGSFGYRTLPPAKAQKAGLSFTLRDLDAFYASMEYSLMDYAVIAADHKRSPLPLPVQRKVRAATRAHSKLVLRLRMQSIVSGLQLTVPRWANAGLQGGDLYKRGRVPVLRVWVPTAGTWMTNEELEECEREIRRGDLWGSLQAGDLLRNVAVSDIANEGLVIFDGKYLRDLSHVHDRLGHLPSWLNGLAFSPSYFHNLISCTNGEPVIYLDLTPFLVALSSNITLCKEKTALTSPGGERYAVNRYVYRTACDLVPGTLLGNAGQQGGAGPGGIEVLHPDWAGKVVIETEGTAEAARALLERATPTKREIVPNQPRMPKHANNHPYRILRSLSKPGQIWVVPLYEESARQGRQRS